MTIYGHVIYGWQDRTLWPHSKNNNMLTQESLATPPLIQSRDGQLIVKIEIMSMFVIAVIVLSSLIFLFVNNWKLQ